MQSYFVFWQYLHDSEEGKMYVRRYNVKSYPYVAIIEPRTGSILWKYERNFNLDFICNRLTDFISDNQPSGGKVRITSSCKE